MSLIASPNPVPWNQTGCFVSGSTDNNGDEATKIERQVNGGGYSQVAINLLGSAGALNYSDTFSAEGDVHDFKFYAGADEFSMTLQDTLTGVKRGRKQAVGSSIAPAASVTSSLKRSLSVVAGGSALVHYKKSGSSYADAVVPGASAGGTVLIGDWDGDGKADIAFWYSTGYWYIYKSSSQYRVDDVSIMQWGTSGDIPVAGDFDGDGLHDLVVFRPSNGTWYIAKSHSGAFDQTTSVSFGSSGDIPLMCKYYGNAQWDLVTVRNVSGIYRWDVRKTSDGTSTNFDYGGPSQSDQIVVGDWDGNGSVTAGIWRAPTTTFYGTNSAALVIDVTFTFGSSNDTAVRFSGDFDGDGKTDFAVWRASNKTLYVRKSSDGTTLSWSFGVGQDTPAIGDFDGDGKSDPALLRTGVNAAASLASVTLKRSRPITASIAAASTPSAPLLKVARALSASIAGLSTPSTPLLKVARRLVGSAVTGAATLATPILKRVFNLASVTVTGAATLATPILKRVFNLASVTVAGLSTPSAPDLKRLRGLAASGVSGVATVASSLRAAWRLAASVAASASLAAPLLRRAVSVTTSASGAVTMGAPLLKVGRALNVTSGGAATIANSRLGYIWRLASSVAASALVEGWFGLLKFARPVSDVSSGSWGTAPLYDKLDEVSPDDADYIQSGPDPASDACEVALSAVPDPAYHTDHIVQYRLWRAAAPHTVDITVELREGTTVIASWTHTNVSTTPTTYSQTLTTVQAGNITDYSALSLRFVANYPG